MKKILFIAILTLIINCSKSEDEPVNTDIITSFEEPILNFGITKSELFAIVGEPSRERAGATNLGIEAVYNIFKDGIENVVYVFNYTSVTQTEPILTDIEIYIKSSAENKDYLISWLNIKYSDYSLYEGLSENWYSWNHSNYNLELHHFTFNNEITNLKLKYSSN